MPNMVKILVLAYLIIVGIMSMVSFISYGLDKRQAKQGGRRISERSLHLLALFGGWPGALWGQSRFRHKTQKVSFRIVFWLMVLVHVSVVVAVGYALYQWEQGSV